MNKPPIFVLGCTKSGTSLLRNLFDGHSSVFAAPAESHFFRYTGSWVSYFLQRSQPKKMTHEEMKNQLLNYIIFSNRRINKVADGFTTGKWNVEAFRETLFSRPVENLRELSDLYIEAMYASLYNTPLPDVHFLEKSVENVEFVLEWLKLYPGGKFIHILRNPYSNLVAIRKFIKGARFPFLNRAIMSMYTSYYFLYKNLGLVDPQQYKVVIYEDLINDPEKIMKELSSFIGIEFEPILLTPSMFGEPWSGNSTSGLDFSGVSKLNLHKWKKDITKYEISIVNELFMHVLRDFNFEVINAKNSKKTILPKEGVINYLMNKLSYQYLPKPKTATLDPGHKPDRYKTAQKPD